MAVMKQSIQPVWNLLLAAVLLFLASPYAGAFCFDEAGERHGVSPELLRAIAEAESDFDPRAVNYNKNGSYDYGVMQINSSWHGRLGREGWMNLKDACYNVNVGAWILSQCMQRHGYTWEAVGCYNGVTKEKRIEYANRVYRILKARSKLVGGPKEQ